MTRGRTLDFWRIATATVLAGGMVAAAPQTATAQDMVYTPINPTFGGNPFNSAHLLGLAAAQNKTTDPTTATNQTEAEIFAQQLQSRLLSALSSQIVDAIFGDNPQQSGTIKFGGQTITFDRGLQDVTLTITQDGGATTTIVVPTYVTTAK